MSEKRIKYELQLNLEDTDQEVAEKIQALIDCHKLGETVKGLLIKEFSTEQQTV